jgi:hypothetical protein
LSRNDGLPGRGEIKNIYMEIKTPPETFYFFFKKQG